MPDIFTDHSGKGPIWRSAQYQKSLYQYQRKSQASKMDISRSLKEQRWEINHLNSHERGRIPVFAQISLDFSVIEWRTFILHLTSSMQETD